MPKPEKNAMTLVDACRSPIRRKIMILAEEAAATGKVLTALSASQALGYGLSGVSYHVKVLFKAGALEVVGGAQQRGAWQKHYLPTEKFKATMTDSVALDQIAELAETSDNGRTGTQFLDAVVEIVRATGRPVEA